VGWFGFLDSPDSVCLARSDLVGKSPVPIQLPVLALGNVGSTSNRLTTRCRLSWPAAQEYSIRPVQTSFPMKSPSAFDHRIRSIGNTQPFYLSGLLIVVFLIGCQNKSPIDATVSEAVESANPIAAVEQQSPPPKTRLSRKLGRNRVGLY
jgi:hypothetical protein